MTRTYRLGKRQPAIARTSSGILAAARALVEQAPATALSVGAVARRAGVTRATVYNHFGSRAGLLRALLPASAAEADGAGDPREAVRRHFAAATAAWAASPALFRHLAQEAAPRPDAPRRLAETLAAGDALRPGCSIREAEDVIGALSSFAVFDRLHQGGRRPASAVTEILMRLAGAVLA